MPSANECGCLRTLPIPIAADSSAASWSAPLRPCRRNVHVLLLRHRRSRGVVRPGAGGRLQRRLVRALGEKARTRNRERPRRNAPCLARVVEVAGRLPGLRLVSSAGLETELGTCLPPAARSMPLSNRRLGPHHREQLPLPRNPLQLMEPAVVEVDPGAGDEVLTVLDTSTSPGFEGRLGRRQAAFPGRLRRRRCGRRSALVLLPCEGLERRERLLESRGRGVG